jgi:hypothetical protein
MDRRDFLRLAGGAALLYGAPFLSSCSKTAHNQSVSELLADVRKIQSSLSAFPTNPVAVAWDPEVNYYPRLRDVTGWFRDKSNVYPLVEKAMMRKIHSAKLFGLAIPLSLSQIGARNICFQNR